MKSKTTFRLWMIMAFAIHFLAACKPDTDTDTPNTREKQDHAIQELNQSFEKLKTENTSIVDFRVLKEALPEKVLGMPRAGHSGQKSGFGDLMISMAEATYEDGDKKIEIKLMDTGGLGAALAGLAGWSQIEMDKEDEQGYERTTMIADKKAFEKYNRVTKEGEIAMINADRFIVSINGHNISEDDLRKAISQIRIKS